MVVQKILFSSSSLEMLVSSWYSEDTNISYPEEKSCRDVIKPAVLILKERENKKGEKANNHFAMLHE